MNLLLFLVVLVVAAAIAVAYYRYQAKRREDLLLVATQNGLTYDRRDMIGVGQLPFRFFQKGDTRKWENVVHGQLGGDPVCVFDYRYVEKQRDAQGKESSQTYRFTCAVAPLPNVFVPRVAIERENLLTRLKDRTGFRDIEFESEDFNRTFEVDARDRRFAFDLIDARMMHWLLATPDDLAFEVLGNHVLVISKPRPADGWMTLHHVAIDFTRRIPNIVRDRYVDQ